MVDFNSHPTPDDSFESIPDTQEYLRMRRYEQIAQAHRLLVKSLELDTLMPRDKHTKKFVSIGKTDKYPFVHFRIKLKPKNRLQSNITVAVLRFPTIGLPNEADPQVQQDSVYVAWETSDGAEEAFILDTDAFSVLDLATAFEEPNDKGGWPSTEARTRADEIKQFTLQALLEDFEPDLQTHSPEVSA